MRPMTVDNFSEISGEVGSMAVEILEPIIGLRPWNGVINYQVEPTNLNEDIWKKYIPFSPLHSWLSLWRASNYNLIKRCVVNLTGTI